jgi:hypothetical protein
VSGLGIAAFVAAGSNLVLLILLFVPFGMAIFAESPILQALLADRTPSSQRATAYSVYFAVTFGVGALWAVVIGTIIGIHVVHIVIDGAVDAPDTLGKMLGAQRFEALRERKGGEHDGLLLPAQIADTYFHLAHQHRSAWTHELDLRAHSDVAWWNHSGRSI